MLCSGRKRTISPTSGFLPLLTVPRNGRHADADVLRGRQTLQHVHRSHLMHSGNSAVVLEDFGKMSDGAAQRPVAKYVAFLEASFGIEGVLILPPLASSARMGSSHVFRTKKGK